MVPKTHTQQPLESYSINLACDNCKLESWHHNIPKGQKARDVLEDKKCRFCDCHIIVKQKGGKY